MDSYDQFLVSIGGILLLGLLMSVVASRTFLPRVTLLLILGIIIGEGLLDIIPEVLTKRFEIIADITLSMVGFILGGKLSRSSLKESANEVVWISVSAAMITAIIVILALMLVGAPKEVAIILGCLAAATDPAAILNIIEESRGKERFPNMLLSVTALDDVWALVMFGIGMAIITTFSVTGSDASFLLPAAKEIFGAVFLGLCLGLPAAFLTGRVKRGQPILTEALGIVFICAGLAMWLEVSYLIAAMTMGSVITNLAKHHKHPFHAIEGIEQIFMIIFFVLAGASLELISLQAIGLIGVVYIVFRTLGKWSGAYLGGLLSGSEKKIRRWTGVALFPQAGVAIGMALVASNHFPEYRSILLSVAISSTVIFEIIGPIFTRMTIRRVCDL